MIPVLYLKVGPFTRILAKIGICQIVFDEGDKTKSRSSGYKLFHYCDQCDDYRYSHIYDPLSKTERCECSGCGVVIEVSSVIGESNFAKKECARLARKLPGSFFKNYTKLRFTRMSGYLPEDREGKTLSDLESVEISSMIWGSMVDRMGKDFNSWFDHRM